MQNFKSGSNIANISNFSRAFETFPEPITNQIRMLHSYSKKMCLLSFRILPALHAWHAFIENKHKTMQKMFVWLCKHKHKTKQNNPWHHLVRLDETNFMVFVACFDVQCLSRYISSKNENSTSKKKRWSHVHKKNTESRTLREGSPEKFSCSTVFLFLPVGQSCALLTYDFSVNILHKHMF